MIRNGCTCKKDCPSTFNPDQLYNAFSENNNNPKQLTNQTLLSYLNSCKRKLSNGK